MSNILYTAVKAIIKNNEGKVLVLRQSDPTISGANQFHAPGGIIEFGENLRDCITREVYEEIGVRPTVGELYEVGEWTAERDNDRMQFVGLFYECRLPSYDFVLETEEVSEAYWVDLKSLDTIDILEPSKSIIKRFLEQSHT